MKQELRQGTNGVTKMSPEGRTQPPCVNAYLAAREALGLPAPQEMWGCRNGWVHYRDEHGAYTSFRKSQLVQMTAELNRRAAK